MLELYWKKYNLHKIRFKVCLDIVSTKHDRILILKGELIMACFLIPTAEAILVTGAALVTRSIEKKRSNHQPSLLGGEMKVHLNKDSMSKKLFSLSKLLYGGSFLLAFEHAWNGEIVPWYPFLTATSNPSATAQMIHEMSTVGVAMSLVITGAWALYTLTKAMLSRKAKTDSKKVCVA